MLKTIYDPIEVDGDYFSQHEAEQNQFYAKIRTIPEAVSNILFGVDTPEIIEKICRDYQLNDERSKELSRLIRKVLVVELYLGNIVSEIAKQLSTEQNLAKEIANRLVAELFAPALEDIKRLHMEKFAPSPKTMGDTAAKSQENINPNNVLDLRDKS